MDARPGQSISQLLEDSARRYPDRIAVVHGDARIRYADLDASADRIASGCIELGVAPGDRVALMMENSVDYISAYYGALKAGAVAVPIHGDAAPDAVAALVASAEPSILIASKRCERAVRAAGLSGVTVCGVPDLVERGGAGAVRTEPDPEQLASVIFTSGSTGGPKGVMLSHANIVANVLSICEYLELTHDDIQMVVLPFSYVMGKSLLNTHVAVGGTVVINNTFAYPASVIEQMVTERVTGFSGVPSTYAQLLHRSPLRARRDRLESLRYCTQAGGHMAAQTKRELLDALPAQTRLFVMYGATEASARLTYLDPALVRERIDSIGRPIPGVTLRVMDESGVEVGTGETGELVASGRNIMQGYWREPEATAAVLDHDGYHTGDLGYRDEEGFFFVTGRRDSLLKVSGHRVNPKEVEETFMNSGLLVEVVVLGEPDGLKGHRLVALAVPKDPALTEQELMRSCASRMPRHARPGEIHLVRSLPKTAAGKIDLVAVRREAGRSAGPPES